jgi:soluble lytic murein transglycosylase
MSKRLIYFFLFFTLFCFQNFSTKDLKFTSLHSIDNDTRSGHARELLGKKYFGSMAQKAEVIPNFNISLYGEVAQSLPITYKSRAFKITEAIISSAYENDLDPVFLYAVIKTESQFNPVARGSHGEIGLMQIKPVTAKWISKKAHLRWHGKSSLENPIENIRLGAAYFSILRSQSKNKASQYLTAYNIGLSKLRQLSKSDIFPKQYSLRVMKNYKTCYEKIVSMQNIYTSNVF